MTTRRPTAMRLILSLRIGAKVLLGLGEAFLESLDSLRDLGAGVLAAARQLRAGRLAAAGELATGAASPPCQLVHQLPRALAGGGGGPGGRLQGALDGVAQRVRDPAVARPVATIAQGWKAYS